MNKIISRLLYPVLLTSFGNATITSDELENSTQVIFNYKQEEVYSNIDAAEIYLWDLAGIEGSPEVEEILKNNPYKPYSEHVFNGFSEMLWKFIKRNLKKLH